MTTLNLASSGGLAAAVAEAYSYLSVSKVTAPAPSIPPPVLLYPSKITPTTLPIPAPTTLPKPCSTCAAKPPAAAPAPAPSSAAPPTVGFKPYAGGDSLPVLKSQTPAGGITPPRDPRDLLVWLEENGGIMLWVILAIIVLSIWSRKGGGSRTW